MTFAFVDVVESTKTFVEHGEAFVESLAGLHDQVRRHAAAVGGSVVKTEGDGAFLAFGSAKAAVEALVALQTELDRVPVDVVPRLRLRAGAHTGDAVPVADDYVALAVNVAARVTSAAGAGQVLVSAATQAELSSSVGVCLGEYALKDVRDPLELWRVCGDETPLRAPLARRTNVQIPVTEFVGRERELAELGDLIAEHRLVTVLGPGGLGKTRLVSELVLQIAAGIEGGAWMVELASLSMGDQVPGAVGQILGVPSSEVGAVAAELRRRGEVVLVLDNCEHLIEPVADLVTELYEACPALSMVCTSREPLQVPGEHVWRLSSLVEQSARFELFTQRARASGAVLPDDSAEVVDRLCTALDGLPLAIELAATQSGSTTLQDLVRIAEHGTDDLARRGGQRRQRSLDAVLAWSLDCLPAERRNSLLALSTIPGRFDHDMATTILDTIEKCEPNAVRPLARASLIDLDGESFRILDTIRHAAQRRLATDPDLTHQARLGLRTWALQTAETLKETQAYLHEDCRDAVLALESALEQAMDDGVAGIGTLWTVVRSTTYYREPSARVMALARRVVAGRLPTDADQDRCFASAIDVLQQGEGRSLSVPDDRLEEICAATDARGVQSYPDLHFRLVMHYAERGDTAAAQRHADLYASHVAARPDASLKDRRKVHQARLFVADAAGDYEEAQLHAERDLEASRLGDLVDLEVGEVNVAEALLNLGRPHEALPHAMEAVRLSPQPSPARRFCLLQLARAHAQLGMIDAGLSTAREIQTELVASGRPAERIEAELRELRRQLPGLYDPAR